MAFSYADRRPVLRDVTFHLRPGSFHFLTGPSGAGKSTLLKLIIMSEQPLRGKIHLLGQDVTSVAPARRADLRRRIGVTFQNNPMLNYLTVRENVGLPLHIMGKAESDYREDVADLLQWVGLGDYLEAAPEELSGGQLQRVGIARAVIGKPELVLADEPTGNVDPTMGRRLLRLFIELNRLGTAIVIATHDHQLMRQFRAPRLELVDGHVRIV